MSKKNLKIGLTFASLSLLVNLFIIANAFIPGTISGQMSDFIANIVKFFINGIEKDVEEIKTESISLTLDERYLLNGVEGYKENEIPLGATKKLIASPNPKNATDANIYFTCSSDKINVIQADYGAFIEANEDIDSFIVSARVKDSDIHADYTFYVKEHCAPVDFSISIENSEIKTGLTEIINVTPISKIESINDPLKYVRYFDSTKLEYISSNTSVATINNLGVITAKSPGTTQISVSNGIVTKKETITVKNNTETIVKPNNNWKLTSKSNKAYIGDMNFDGFDYNEVGMHNTPLLVDWNGAVPSDDKLTYVSSNPLIAMVDNNGVVRGYRKKGTVTITATSTLDPSQSASINITVEDVLISSLEYANEKKSFQIEKGVTLLITPKYLPINASDKKMMGKAENASLVEIESRGSSVAIKGLETGKTKVTIYAVNSESATLEYEVEVTPLKIINSANEDDFFSIIRKSIGHLTLFFIDGIFTTLGAYFLIKDNKKKYYRYLIYLASLLFGFSIAMLSEFIQLFIPKRGARWIDVGIDTLGYASAVFLIALIFLIIFIIKKVKNKKKEEIDKN